MRNQVERIVRRAIVIITDYVVLISAVGAVAKVFIREISYVNLGAVYAFEPN
jgi:hypothetical protein